MKKFITTLLSTVFLINVFAQSTWKIEDYSDWNHSNFRQNQIFNQPFSNSNPDYLLLDAALFFITNEERAKVGIESMRYHKLLEVAAYNHSMKMATTGFFSHQNSKDASRSSTSDRGKLAGVSNPSFAENIASYSPVSGSYMQVAAKLINQWMNSPGHKANILSAKGRQMGCGAFYYDGHIYATQVFQWFSDVIEDIYRGIDQLPKQITISTTDSYLNAGKETNTNSKTVSTCGANANNTNNTNSSNNTYNSQLADQKDLKAILIVGHQEDGTANAIKYMDKIADIFLENKVSVHKFYDYKANWDEIIEKAKECSFFVYSGHGSNMGENGNVGGICINSMISSSELIDQLRLKEDALVIFKSVCNGAGSSAGDDNDIGITEAKKRVSYYAYPFFEIGASAYYANNFGDGVYNFLTDFLSGVTLKQSYLNSTKKWTNVEFEEVFSRDTSKFFSIASTPGGGTGTRTSYTNGVKKVEQVEVIKGYSISYVGKPGFSILDID